jgi:hypothetical protein
LRIGPLPGGPVERAAEAILAETGPALGAPKAITATAHELARIVDNLMRYGGRT